MQSIGKRMAAACKGDMTKDIKGTPIMARGPANPPFAIPYNKTAGIDTR